LKTLHLDGTSLSLDDLATLARGAEVRIDVTPAALEAVQRSRELVEERVRAGDVVYGLTTGFGKLKNVAIAAEDLDRLQQNLVLSHCCGVGEPMPAREVRVAQVLRLNGLVRGYSGIRVELVEALVRLFNAGFVPVVPQQGSVGASGDLAPLAHMAATYMGHGEAWVRGERQPTGEENSRRPSSTARPFSSRHSSKAAKVTGAPLSSRTRRSRPSPSAARPSMGRGDPRERGVT